MKEIIAARFWILFRQSHFFRSPRLSNFTLHKIMLFFFCFLLEDQSLITYQKFSIVYIESYEKLISSLHDK
jgi:hypothetical protein